MGDLGDKTPGQGPALARHCHEYQRVGNYAVCCAGGWRGAGSGADSGEKQQVSGRENWAKKFRSILFR